MQLWEAGVQYFALVAASSFYQPSFSDKFVFPSDAEFDFSTPKGCAVWLAAPLQVRWVVLYEVQWHATTQTDCE
jgi:hypothetical protein